MLNLKLWLAGNFISFPFSRRFHDNKSSTFNNSRSERFFWTLLRLQLASRLLVFYITSHTADGAHCVGVLCVVGLTLLCSSQALYIPSLLLCHIGEITTKKYLKSFGYVLFNQFCDFMPKIAAVFA
jgi:hypothetical protein